MSEEHNRDEETSVVYKSIKGPVPEELKQNCGWEKVPVSACEWVECCPCGE